MYLLLSGGKPVVTIQSPLEGTRIQVGSEAVLQATETGKEDIARLELIPDRHHDLRHRIGGGCHGAIAAGAILSRSILVEASLRHLFG